jgi:hypothetical protein
MNARQPGSFHLLRRKKVKRERRAGFVYPPLRYVGAMELRSSGRHKKKFEKALTVTFAKPVVARFRPSLKQSFA